MYARSDVKPWLLLLVLAGFACASVLTVARQPTRAGAQAAGPALVINQLDASNYPTLRAVVTVLDERGLPVPDLTPAQFQAFDAGTQLPISSAVPASDNNVQANVVLVMDVSGSMEGEPLAAAKAAAAGFVESLAPGDRAALIAFNGQVTPVVTLTDDRVALTSAIDALTAEGDTALFEAVQVGSYVASAAATGGNRAAVVLLSDGENDTSTSQATAETSLGAATGSGVPVYSIAFGELTDHAYLQSLSSATGGALRDATAGSIGDVYAELSLLLRSQYLLTIEASAPADGGPGSLEIVALPNGGSAAATASFVRGAAAPISSGGGATGSASDGQSNGGGGSGLLIYGGIALAVLVVLGGGAYAGRRWIAGRRELAHQLAVIAPNQELAAAQGVPRRVGALAPAPSTPVAVASAVGTGRLIEHGGQSRIVEIGAGPLVLGTSPKRCQVVLSDHGAIAPEHARIWLRGNRYVLHHVGGMSRKTLVGGHEADWVVLDPGDEITIGAYRFVFDDGRA